MLVLLFPAALCAQRPAAADTTAGADAGTPAVTYGATSGALGLQDGRTQSGVSAVVRWHIGSGFAVGALPAFAHNSYPASLGGGSASGLTDLPLELSYDHTFSGAMPTTLGGGFSMSLPLGDTTAGFGSGNVGYSVNAGFGIQPSEGVSLHVGAGKPLTDYALSAALGGSNSMWGDAEATYQVTDRVGATLGFDGDFASSDSLGAARTIAGGLELGLNGPLTLTLNAAHGISGPAARWQFAVGLGTDFAGMSSLGSSSPVQRLVRALGGRSHSRTTTTGSGRRRP